MKFVKDKDNKWYVDLPEWTGEKWELEMVEGADTLCDILAQGADNIDVQVSLNPIEGGLTLKMDIPTPEIGGALYTVSGQNLSDFQIWLCHVTEHVFGFLPETIYIK